MMTLKKASDLLPGDNIENFGKVYHVWYHQFKIQVAVKKHRIRSYYPEQEIIVDMGYMGSLPNLESEMMFRDRIKQMWMEPV